MTKRKGREIKVFSDIRKKERKKGRKEGRKKKPRNSSFSPISFEKK
jgi:hypothetical protein